ncbi:MAG: flagellar hook protein FlgE [SAR324 cluster bacterium]|uniref:Flagellar hook protein FlgE n=1 Tax=SAR324 cluster bacterium TaxID=2024889 RepID=A0A7X9FTB7_9DELT|nr:flagellar hook protein FlgE [SAR324 cluster bacterium]
MPSIVNGLFAGRSGISSHGTAIAVVGDNISNSSTIGYKTSRAEFEDLIAGGQTAGKVVGSGSQTSAVSTIFQQGTLEYTGRTLDLGIDGNGFFVVADGSQRFYTRAGNFKINSAGYIVDQHENNVLGFPANGSGALSALNVNTISQNNVATNNVAVAGNLSASAEIIDPASIPAVDPADGSGASTTTYAELNAVAEFSTVVDIFDSLGAKHTLTYFFFHTGANQYTVRGYVNSEDVDSAVPAPKGYPRVLGDGSTTDMLLNFKGDGSIDTTDPSTVSSIDLNVPWNNGANASTTKIDMSAFTQYSASSNILSITQDGQGIGTVTNLNIQANGDIYAMLDNGQTAIIGTIGMVNFSNAEGLTRIGKNMLLQSPQSGEPIVGKPQSGTLGAVKSGSIELSTVDIADQFVKIITLQRGFQANSRIITTINQLLNEIIQLA